MPQSRPPARPLPPGQRFKPQIEKAVAGGATFSELLLHLTFSDASRLKRDPNVAAEDLSFQGGEIHYLGVKVVEGGVAESTLVMLTT